MPNLLNQLRRLPSCVVVISFGIKSPNVVSNISEILFPANILEDIPSNFSNHFVALSSISFISCTVYCLRSSSLLVSIDVLPNRISFIISLIVSSLDLVSFLYKTQIGNFLKNDMPSLKNVLFVFIKDDISNDKLSFTLLSNMSLTNTSLLITITPFLSWYPQVIPKLSINGLTFSSIKLLSIAFSYCSSNISVSLRTTFALPNTMFAADLVFFSSRWISACLSKRLLITLLFDALLYLISFSLVVVEFLLVAA